MIQCYFEKRNNDHQLAIDIAKHLQYRQNLGKTIIITDRPAVFMGSAHRQWHKLTKLLQKERSSTVNAEKILRLTHTITHMHRMTFTSKQPEYLPSAHVFFITPSQVSIFPINTYSVYLTCKITPKTVADIAKQLPSDALIVDYYTNLKNSGLTLRPKAEAHKRIASEWEIVQSFLKKNNIDIDELIRTAPHQTEAIDDALDVLLNYSRDFLQVANNFQHVLELSQPIVQDKKSQNRYDILILLAHRVQALDPFALSNRFTYNLVDPDAFFLHDIEPKEDLTKDLTSTIAYHHQAGRKRLARALSFASTSEHARLK